METEAGKVQETIQASNRALTISSAQYKAGTTSYLTVLTSQAAFLSAQRTAVVLQTRRLNASVLLIEALGGGGMRRGYRRDRLVTRRRSGQSSS